ncbi:hypothetical protein [Laceyella tengchongensis]
MQGGIRGIFVTIGEAITFYKEHFWAVLVFSLSVLLPLDIFLLIIKQLSILLPGLDNLYYVLVPVVFAVIQLPFILISVMFIKDEPFEIREIYSMFFGRISNAYIASLFFALLMYLLTMISKPLGIVGFFLAFSIPYLVVLKEYDLFTNIKKSTGLGIQKCVQMLAFFCCSILLYWTINSAVSAGIGFLIKETVPELLFLFLKLLIDMLLVPFGVYILTKSYSNWLTKGQ